MWYFTAGIQTWLDQSKYRGDYVDNYRHGIGRYYWPNGEVSTMYRKLLNCGIDAYGYLIQIQRTFGFAEKQVAELALTNPREYALHHGKRQNFKPVT